MEGLGPEECRRPPSAAGGPDGFWADFMRWAAAERASSAASERARVRVLRDQSAATATWAGFLLDLAERSAAVSLMVAGAPYRGRLVGVGVDVCFLELDAGRPAFARIDAVSWLSPADGPADRVPSGDRRPPEGLSLAGLLETLAGEAAPLRLHVSGQPVMGRLLAVGEDVLTLRPDGPGRSLVHLPLLAVQAGEIR